MKVYTMPNGRKYQFSDGNVPEGAVPVKAKTEVQNKAKKPSTKVKKAGKK